ncbi:YTH domain-containing protein 1-like isoform X2 [Coffea eugenioides]|uniref:YTH domain-containing family protein n=1 Tax=Coffea arabica TaxID=13443 RepID=A0A6P6TSK9_COFAR|nr:YTH domain-containing protein 1-like isoform X2 [Coffea arabica]XP_027183526.1 YTH domain-containing protein 1-like isoform X2 [Coffea eugenioides]
MSSDTAKENASVVDSSVTEWKNDRNLDGPESHSYRSNEDGCQIGADEQVHSYEQRQNCSETKKGKPCNTRYFIIKSLNHQNIELSIEKGIWATQVMNEPILEEAFRNSGKVILIFSVNMSGFFQGYAQMMSSIGWRRDNVWSQGTGGNNPWGRTFKVKWLQLHDLPFQKTLHLKNPLNQYKPVKISRDCQELPQDIGEALCELLDGKDDVDVSLKRVEFSKVDLPLRRPCVEPSGSLRFEDFVPSVHMAPTLYPSLVYHHQAEASRFDQGYQRPSAGSHGNVRSDSDTSAQFIGWGKSTERSPLASSLTEDDLLEMTYEEYLEAHSRHNKKLYQSGAVPASNIQKSSVKAARFDDVKLGSSSKKRPRHRSPRR